MIGERPVPGRAIQHAVVDQIRLLGHGRLDRRQMARLRRVAMMRGAVPVRLRGVLGERDVSQVVQGLDGPVPGSVPYPRAE